MQSSFLRSRYSLREDRRGFVSVIVVLLMGFLTVVTASLLWLFVEENKITRTLSSGIATEYGSEGALEYALLKAKNHDHGFEDSLPRDENCPLSISLRNTYGSMPVMSDTLKIGYRMESQVTYYTGTIAGGGYEIIPLYTDTGTLSSVSGCSGLKQVSGPSNLNPFTKDFKLDISTPMGSNAISDKFSWNILVSSGSETVGLAGTGNISSSSSLGNIRSLGTDFSGDKYVSDTGSTIASFLNTSGYTKPFLVLFNNQQDSVDYDLTPQAPSAGNQIVVPFSSPKPCIYATAEIGVGVNTRGQFYRFCQNNSDLLEGLKYSVFSK